MFTLHLVWLLSNMIFFDYMCEYSSLFFCHYVFPVGKDGELLDERSTPQADVNGERSESDVQREQQGSIPNTMSTPKQRDSAFHSQRADDEYSDRDFSPPVQIRKHKDSVTSDDSYFLSLQHSQTPFAAAAMNYSPANSFQPSTRKFYFIHQNALHTGFGTGLQNSNYKDDVGGLSQAEKAFRKIRASKESQSLLEKCVVHKVSPMTLLSVIASRRKSDGTAREFVNKLPADMRKKVYKQLGSPIIDCRSS